MRIAPSLFINLNSSSCHNIIIFYVIFSIHTKDFAEFADGSGDAGFIVFSLGSIVAGLDAEFTELVGSVLKRMPQRVFWKTDHISADIGDNIKVTSWLPQIDLLGEYSVDFCSYIVYHIIAQRKSIGCSIQSLCVQTPLCTRCSALE